MDRRSMLWSAVVAALVCVLITASGDEPTEIAQGAAGRDLGYLSSTAKLPDASEPIREGL